MVTCMHLQVPGRLYPIQLEYCPTANVQYLQPQVEIEPSDGVSSSITRTSLVI